MPNCDFKKVAYRNRTSAWVFSCKFAATLLKSHFGMGVLLYMYFELCKTSTMENFTKIDSD